MNRHLLLAVLPLVLVAALALAPGAAAAGETVCPPGISVAYVWQTISNDVDAGVAGNAWATLGYTRALEIFEIAPLTYCARANSSAGTFTTFRGTSPRATGRLKAGRTGTITHRWRSRIFTGVFLPKVPVSGFIGSYDYRCNESFSCPGFVDWRTLFFAETVGYGLESFTWGFNGGANGLYVRRDFGAAGDIVG